jgi:hypothetical protein
MVSRDIVCVAGGRMAMTEHRHDPQSGSPGRRAYFVPVAWIVALLACYWVMVDWQTVPVLISEALAAIH